MGPLDVKSGADAGSITCILATTKSANGEVIWRTDYPNNVAVAKEKNLDCGVSESALEIDAPEFITLSMRGEQRFGPETSRRDACRLALDKAGANAFVRTSRALGIRTSAYEEHITAIDVTSTNIYASQGKMVCSIYAEITVSRQKTDGRKVIAEAMRSHLDVQPLVATELEPKRSNPSVNDTDELERLRDEIRELRANQETRDQKELAITRDNEPPRLIITKQQVEGVKALIEGQVFDNVQVAEVLINGRPVKVDGDGVFRYSGYIPTGGAEFEIAVFDQAGLNAVDALSLQRRKSQSQSRVIFDLLDPTTRQVKSNSDAIALVVGVAEYSKITAPAEFADRDAQVFYDYAHFKLGIPRDRIQIFVNEGAGEVELLSGVNQWLKRSVKQGTSDVYVFFAGHGLGTQDGETAYLIPFDGVAQEELLERTAISRNEMFEDIASVNPRSVTVFLDTCYSGDTRGESRLIAGRPLGIKLQEQSLPAGFTVLTAAGGDQIAKPLKEAQHGMFSYFLMKGMEGDADSDGNNEITARELHSYVRENVVQQSGGSQVPELQGDGERVLVRFR